MKTKSIQPFLVLLACILISLLIDFLDFKTGEELDLFVFYFIPVAIAAWYLGMLEGLLLAVVSAAAWFHSDILSLHLYSPAVEFWDTIMRLVAFLSLASMTAKVRIELVKEKKLNDDLADALSQIKQLSGILPMCSFCRKIRDENNQWVIMEKYIADHSEAKVSHGLCPSCYKKHYSDPDGT